MTYFVFVDFENVQKVDLALIEGKPVHVTLLIGKNQTKVATSLFAQVSRLPGQVLVVEVGGSGRNALDLTLAYYLGRAIEQIPEANYAIVSKDKDFDPMIAHLGTNGIQIVRKDSFATLPFLQPPKSAMKVEPDLRAGFGRENKTAAPNQPARPVRHRPGDGGRSGSTKPNPDPKAKQPPKAPPVAKPAKVKTEDKLDRLIKHLRNGPPTDRTKLVHTIEDSYKKSPPPGGVEGIITQLVKRKVIALDSATGKVAVL
jgi:hypothetical protein